MERDSSSSFESIDTEEEFSRKNQNRALLETNSEITKNVVQSSNKRMHEESPKRVKHEAEERKKIPTDPRKRFHRTYSEKQKVDNVVESEDDSPDDKDLRKRGLTHQRREKGQISAVKCDFSASTSTSIFNQDNELMLNDKVEFMKTVELEGTEGETFQSDCEISSIEEARKSLAIYAFKVVFIEAVKDNQIIIVYGETGSGKTTQIPQYLYEAGYTPEGKIIGCTQTRSLVAKSAAARVSEEMDVGIGNEVGYSIPFENCTSDQTKIKYITDDMLLREVLSNPTLDSYRVLIIDEVHERTIHTYILLGLLKELVHKRRDLKILIVSSALNAEQYSTFFKEAPLFKIPSRRYPVDIYNTKTPEADYIDACVVSILQIHTMQPPGDILVFLTCQNEIETCQEILEDRIKRLGSKISALIILPLYSDLPSNLQAQIFEPTPPNARKVVLATNIAETSLTIGNIVYVIDTGFVKENNVNSRTGMESLNIVPISKASANQRAARAGRVAHGKCFRLYTIWGYQLELEENTIPEIQRINLEKLVLTLKALGINNLFNFNYLDPPPNEMLALALEHLYALKALNQHGELTDCGRRMAEFPTTPMMATMLLASGKYNCSEEIVTLAAILLVNHTIFYHPKDEIIRADTGRKNFNHPTGDHMTLINIFNEWVRSDYSEQWCNENFIQHQSLKRARNIRERLVELMQRMKVNMKSCNGEDVNVQKAIVAGYFRNIARFSKEGHYKTVKHTQTVAIHPNSTLFEKRPRLIIYHELVFTFKDSIRQCTEIKSEWVLQEASHYYQPEELEDSANKKNVENRQQISNK